MRRAGSPFWDLALVLNLTLTLTHEAHVRDGDFWGGGVDDRRGIFVRWVTHRADADAAHLRF